MAQLEKMSLKGIRSFNPETFQDLEFYPLTLILGVNGAGKTTIIEALRYVTSGEFPPGSNAGKLWIHDPLLQEHGNRVRAQVKLKFTGSDGDSSTVTRTLEMTTRKSSAKGGVTQQLKTVESQVENGATKGDRRCADMTTAMLSRLKVSKAVLTNVVFCHQEDNCWPLSEGKVLKEKFDQIFGSIQYVKSLAKIKKIREDQFKTLKAKEAHKETCLEIEGQKAKYESRKRKLEKEIELRRQDRTALEAQLEPIDWEIDEITRKEGDLNRVIREISQIEGQLKGKKSSHVWLEETLGQFEEKTVEEVEGKKREYEQTHLELDQGYRNLRQEIAEKEKEIRKYNGENSKAERTKGELNYQLKQNARNKEKCKEAIKSAQSILSEPCDSDDMGVLKTLLNEQLEKISREDEEGKPQIKELEEKERKLQTQKQLLYKEIEIKQTDQTKRNLELAHLTAELTKIESPAAEILKEANALSQELLPIREKVNEAELFESIDSILERIRLKNYDLDEAVSNLRRLYRNLSKESASSISELYKKIRVLDDEIKEIKVELNKIYGVRNEKDRQARQMKFEISQCLTDLAGCSSDYTPPSDIDAKLAQIKQEQDDCLTKMKQLEAEKAKLAEQQSDIERDVAGHELKVRNFSDKILYLRLTDEISKLTESLDEKKQLHGVIDISALTKKKKELNDRRSKIFNEIGTFKGKIEQSYDDLRHIELELCLKKYQSSEEALLKATIDALTTDLLCKDLNTYYRVLDKAVTTFHLRQMHSINQLIAHFWHITYQGGDIETIKIACDEGEDRTADAKRRFYNYRVVMIKNGKEFDMRGRCSAGQKVLASLVIRIALAQIFCRGCSILALDEPTTNLDKNNIEFLAKAIKGIVEDQKGRLQILIITHDEEFLRYIDSEYVEKYYEIIKENGYSTIQAKSLRQRE